MWRWGFTLWRVWVWARLLVPAGLGLWLAWHAWGLGIRFGLAVLLVAALAAGAGFVLRDLASHELGTRTRTRTTGRR